jgi:phospholipid/cholesterol/gamma-HCH transport system substrate-binding protein
MEKDAHYFIVGLFVIAAVAALVGFSVWLAGGRESSHTSNYSVLFTDPVSGLREGASVLYRGVDIGKVLEVRLSPDRKDLIIADIQIDDSAPIRGNTEARLATLGITGLVYMELSTEVSDTSPPRRVKNEKYPVIRGSGTQLAEIFRDMPNITKRILEVTEKINNFLDEETVSGMRQSIANIQSISRDFNGLLSVENITNAGTILQNVAEASEDAPEITARLNEIADEIENMADTFDDMIARNQENIDKFTSEGLGQVTSTAIEARKMVHSFREMADKLNRDPSQIIYQPQSTGVEIAP